MKAVAAILIFSAILTGCASRDAKSQSSHPDETSKGTLRPSDLTGAWAGKAADDTVVTYEFQKQGGVTWIVDGPEFLRRNPSGLRAKYVIREASPVWEIDIYDFEASHFRGITVRGILEPIDRRTFKMESLPSTHGDRPAEFGKEAIVFSKTN